MTENKKMNCTGNALFLLFYSSWKHKKYPLKFSLLYYGYLLFLSVTVKWFVITSPRINHLQGKTIMDVLDT